METLAYLHLALAHEAPIDTEYRGLTSTWESLKLFGRDAMNRIGTQPKLSTRTAVSLLSLSIALGILGMANQVSAAVQEGDRGAEVTAVQQRLRELGYFKANITGYFGSLTKDAVIQFQQATGLEADGIVGTDTLVALGGQPKPSAKTGKQPSQKSVRESSGQTLQLGDRGSQVSALQESLAAAGFPSGTDGIFDEATQKAVMRFQQAKGLVVDGVVGPQTLAALPAIGGPNPSSPRRNASSRSTSRTNSNRSTSRETTNRSTSRTNSNRSTSRESTNRSTSRTNSNRSTSRESTNRSTSTTNSNRSTSRTNSNRSTSRETTNRSTSRTNSNRSTSRETTRLPAPRTITNRSKPRASDSLSAPRTTTSRLNTPSNTPSPSTTEALQKRLKELGFYRGEIDGIWGPQTQAAVEAAQRSYDVSSSDLEKGRL